MSLNIKYLSTGVVLLSASIYYFFLNSLQLLPESSEEDSSFTRIFALVPDDAAEVLPYDGTVKGAEDLLVEPEGTILTGLVDGRIIRLLNPHEYQVVARTGVNHIHKCSKLTQNNAKTACSRPLGLSFASIGAKRKLYICDGWKGLLSVEIEKPYSTESNINEATLVTPENGPTPYIANAISEKLDGKFLFTDTSKNFDAGRFIAILFEGYPTGRLMTYDERSNSSRVILEELKFANGVCLSYDTQYAFVAETSSFSIRKISLNSAADTADTKLTIKLPVPPDNLSKVSYKGKPLYAAAGFAAFFTPVSSEIDPNATLDDQLLRYLKQMHRRFVQFLLNLPSFGGMFEKVLDWIPPAVLEKLYLVLGSIKPYGGQIILFDDEGNLIKWISLPKKCSASSTVVMPAWGSDQKMLIGSFSKEMAPCLVDLSRIPNM